MSSRSSSRLASSEMSSTQNSGEMDTEGLVTLTSTVLGEATDFPDPHDSAHGAKPTDIHDYECFIHQSSASSITSTRYSSLIGKD